MKLSKLKIPDLVRMKQRSIMVLTLQFICLFFFRLLSWHLSIFLPLQCDRIRRFFFHFGQNFGSLWPFLEGLLGKLLSPLCKIVDAVSEICHFCKQPNIEEIIHLVTLLLHLSAYIKALCVCFASPNHVSEHL